MGDNTDNKEMISERSEEVQVIIDRMPTSWVKWLALGTGGLMD